MKRIIIHYDDDLNAKLVFNGLSKAIFEDGSFNTHVIGLYTYGSNKGAIVDARANKTGYTVYVLKHDMSDGTESEMR